MKCSEASRGFRFGSIADMLRCRSDVCFTSRVFREVSPHDRFGDERRLVLPLDLYGDVARQLQAAVDLIHLRQQETTA